MDKIHKLILIRIPMSICNFRCSYCYLAQRDECYQNQQPQYKYSPQHVAKALSQERLGGPSYINLCADGETLLTKDIDLYTYQLLLEGHYVEFTTNLTITKVLDKMLSWDKELLQRLTFKCSFHYLQLKEKKLLDTFAANVKKIWEAGASANIEITPHDELIPYLDEIKEYSMTHFGALPHITIARRDDTEDIEYLTELSIAEYDQIWSSFDSDFWKFKKTIFMQKRNEFCYAGQWSLYVSLETGNATQCYCSRYNQNIFEDLDNPIDFKAIGKCSIQHCYNGHALMTLGCIPKFTAYQYGNIRNRTKPDGTEWLQPKLKSFFNTKLEESNSRLSESEERRIMKQCDWADRKAAMHPKLLARKILGNKTIDIVKNIIKPTSNEK